MDHAVRDARRGQGDGGRDRRRCGLRRRHGDGHDRHAAAGDDAGCPRRLPRQFTTSGGAATWTKQIGTTADEQIWGVAADASGNATVAGYSSGDLFGTQQGDKDIVVATFDSAGTLTAHDQIGTIGNDKGASVALDGTGNTYVSGFSEGNLETNIGSFDAVLLKYGPGLTRIWGRQFGTTESDGADAFAEGNVFLAVHGGTIWASGFTMGSTDTQTNAGNGDVFLTSFDSAGTTWGNAPPGEAAPPPSPVAHFGTGSESRRSAM